MAIRKMTSVPVRPAATAGGYKRGPQKWACGDKLWDSMIFHKKTMTLANYALKTNVTEVGNDAVYNGLKNPELFFSVEAFSEAATGSAFELFNGGLGT